MDDTLKIKALMIFFEHWGKEEARTYKNLDGLKKFDKQIRTAYDSRYETAMDALKNTDMTSMRFWSSMVDCLLPGMDHWAEYYDFINKPLYAKIRFAESIGAVFYDIAHVDVADGKMKQVDAVVALPPLRL
jgi:hypothetical protein